MSARDKDVEEGWRLFSQGVGLTRDRKRRHATQDAPVEALVAARSFGDSDDDAPVGSATPRRPVDAMLEYMRLSTDHDVLTEQVDLSTAAVSLLHLKGLHRDLTALYQEADTMQCAMCKAKSMVINRTGLRVCTTCGFARSDVFAEELGPCIESNATRHRERMRDDDELPSARFEEPAQSNKSEAVAPKHARAKWVYGRLARGMDADTQRRLDMADYVRALRPEMEKIARAVEPAAAGSITTHASGTNTARVSRQSLQRHSASRRASALQLLQEMHRVQGVKAEDLPMHTGRIPIEQRKRSLLSNAPCFSRNTAHGEALLRRVASHHTEQFCTNVLMAFGDVMMAYRRLGRILRYNLLLPLIALWQATLVSGYLVEGVDAFLVRWTPQMTEDANRSSRGRDVLEAGDILLRTQTRFWGRRLEFLAVLEQPNPSRADGRWGVRWDHTPFEWIRARALWILHAMFSIPTCEYALPRGHANLLREHVPVLRTVVESMVTFMEKHAASFTTRRQRDVNLSSESLARARESGGSAGRIASALSVPAHRELARSACNTRFERALSLAPTDLQRMATQESLAAAVVLDVMDRLNTHVPALEPRLVEAVRRHYRRRISPSPESDSVSSASDETPSMLAARFGVPSMTLQRAALTVTLCEEARRDLGRRGGQAAHARV